MMRHLFLASVLAVSTLGANPEKTPEEREAKARQLIEETILMDLMEELQISAEEAPGEAPITESVE